MTRRLATVIAVSSLGISTLATPPNFTFRPAGELVANSGTGSTDTRIYLEDMRFPIETDPAFANSQVWGRGGGKGPAGTSQCDAENYSYPWRDTFCETRAWDMPLCPGGKGHQGVDIRPATCKKDLHWVVAAVDGTITKIGPYSVYLTGTANTRVDYLHMSSVQVKVGQQVTRGTRLGKVSNLFKGTPTTIHLHFNLFQNTVDGWMYVPPYTSLVAAYQAMRP
jgi:murein DD-endopeptidase MepM/ murein hydrolase activator NlpD